MEKKIVVFINFKIFNLLVEKQSECSIKKLKNNGIGERKNRSILNMEKKYTQAKVYAKPFFGEEYLK